MSVALWTISDSLSTDGGSGLAASSSPSPLSRVICGGTGEREDQVSRAAERGGGAELNSSSSYNSAIIRLLPFRHTRSMSVGVSLVH